MKQKRERRRGKKQTRTCPRCCVCVTHVECGWRKGMEGIFFSFCRSGRTTTDKPKLRPRARWQLHLFTLSANVLRRSRSFLTSTCRTSCYLKSPQTKLKKKNWKKRPSSRPWFKTKHYVKRKTMKTKTLNPMWPAACFFLLRGKLSCVVCVCVCVCAR